MKNKKKDRVGVAGEPEMPTKTYVCLKHGVQFESLEKVVFDERLGWRRQHNGGGKKKRSCWTRAMAWLQQLAPDVTMKLLIKTYQNIYKFTRAA